MPHRTEALQENQADEQPDQFRHAITIVMDGNNVPERAGQAQQGQIDGGDSHHEESSQDHS